MSESSELGTIETGGLKTRDSNLYRIDRLHYWLTLEGSSFLLVLAGGFVPIGIVLVCLICAAGAFLPYMVKVLYQEKRHGWIVGLAVLSGIEACLLLLPIKEMLFRTVVLMYLPLLMFYGYCWALRFAVGQWLLELREETGIRTRKS